MSKCAFGGRHGRWYHLFNWNSPLNPVSILLGGHKFHAFPIMPHELQTRRGRAFFWIGLGVLPVFWLAWMKPRDFTSFQIRAARFWTALFIALTCIAWYSVPVFHSGITALPTTYSHVAFITGGALLVWLLLRSLTLIEAFFLPFIFGPYVINWIMFTLHHLEPHPAAFLFILVPALLHLVESPQKQHISGNK